MKYIITENRMNELIYNYIVDLFESNSKGELNFSRYEDDMGNESEIAFQFYFVPSSDLLDGEPAFRWYSKEYFEFECEKCPIVEMSSELEDELNGLFSDSWKELFKLWIKNKFNLEVKTIE